MSAKLLTAKQESRLIAETKSDLVEALITRKHPVFQDGDVWDYYLEIEICGLLRTDRRTLRTWDIPKYPIGEKGVTYYRLSEVKAYLQSKRDR